VNARVEKVLSDVAARRGPWSSVDGDPGDQRAFTVTPGSLPLRLTTEEVCRLGRFSVATFWRRRRAGTLPGPVDRGRQSLFDRDSVLVALRIGAAPIQLKPKEGAVWRVDRDAIRKTKLR
jgi:hypothetical protein